MHSPKSKCPLCNGKTQSNKPCKLRTCKFAPKCWHHTPVEVKPSNIPNAGRGLFAKRNIPPGEYIADYTIGTRAMTEEQFEHKYPEKRKATHVWQGASKVYYDATNGEKSIAGMVNRPPRGKHSNARITNTGRLRSKKKRIRTGTEVLVGYNW